MNLFAVDYDPARAAECLPSKLVVKMPLEISQMLAVNLGPLYLNWAQFARRMGLPTVTKAFASPVYSLGSRVTRKPSLDDHAWPCALRRVHETLRQGPRRGYCPS
jgi:hypothetical protein